MVQKHFTTIITRLSKENQIANFSEIVINTV